MKSVKLIRNGWENLISTKILNQLDDANLTLHYILNLILFLSIKFLKYYNFVPYQILYLKHLDLDI